MMVASMPGRSSSGSMRIFTVSGATVRHGKGEGRREKNNNNNNGNNSRELRGGNEKLSTYSARLALSTRTAVFRWHCSRPRNDIGPGCR